LGDEIRPAGGDFGRPRSKTLHFSWSLNFAVGKGFHSNPELKTGIRDSRPEHRPAASPMQSDGHIHGAAEPKARKNKDAIIENGQMGGFGS